MMDKQEESSSKELIKSGQNFLGILNDIKRRPEDAARELEVSLDEINSILSGKKELSVDIVDKATKIWPVNARDFYVIHDDCPQGIKIMRCEESKQSSRIMERAGSPYYEYRDTAMSKTAPFRPEWILELCSVDDNDPRNKSVQWNNGHFLHQFTYFVGEVNFYYIDSDAGKKVAVMNTGDSMYITPFVSHAFASRNGTKQPGLILALTYGNKITGDTQQELSTLSNLGQEFVLDFSTAEKAISALIKYFRKISSLSLEEISKRTNIPTEKIVEFESGKITPSTIDLQNLSKALTVNLRDLLPNDKTENKVIVKHHDEGKKWFYPNQTRAYEFVELANTTTLPFSKSFEIKINNTDNKELDLRAGLHQYVYNIDNNTITINWVLDGQIFSEKIHPGDSLYIKPFVEHNFRGEGKLLVLRIGGKIVGDSQRELSFVGKENTKRAISETIQWFNPKGKQ
jgi:methylphosphonate synthase